MKPGVRESLQAFLDGIDLVIRERGQTVYAEGRLGRVQADSEAAWRARVKGERVYKVALGVSAGGGIDAGCSCPYEHGPVCKHVAALAWALLDHDPQDPLQRLRQAAEPRPADVRLKLALERAERADLEQALLELAFEDTAVQDRLALRFATTPLTPREASAKVRRALAQGRSREGFTDYRGAQRAARALDPLLEEAERCLDGDRPEDAARIALAVVEGVVPAINEADDSDGLLAGCVASALALLERAGEAMPPEERAAWLVKLLAAARKEELAGWDWPWDLAALAAEWVHGEGDRRKVLDSLDVLVERDARRSRASSESEPYGLERAETIRLQMIERSGDEAAVRHFLESRAHLGVFRVRLVRHLLERGEVRQAGEAARQWLDHRPGIPWDTGTELRQVLLDIAVREGDRAEVMRWARELLLITGDPSYLSRLASTVPAAEWAGFVDELVEEARREAGTLGVVPLLLAREGRWQAMLEYALGGGRISTSHWDELERRFPQAMCDRYARLVSDALRRAGGRAAYRQAAEMLRRMAELGQDRRVRDLIEAYCRQYPNRPALREELGRALT